MTVNYPNVPHTGDIYACNTSYTTLIEHQEIKLTLLDQSLSMNHVIAVCGDTLYVAPYNHYIEGDQCNIYIHYNMNTFEPEWVFQSMFWIVIYRGTPKGLIFEYKSKPHILYHYN